MPGRSLVTQLTASPTAARVRRALTLTVDSLIEEYHRRYAERDAEGVTNLCLWPFVAIRRGEAIHLPDRNTVRDHFAGAIQAYRFANVEGWKRVEWEVRQLGEHSAFVTAHWNAVDSQGNVLRDTWTSYQALRTPDGWRLLSYTNHF